MHSEMPETPDDELLPEYHFDHSKAKPNRFAPKELRMIRLDPDVAAIFTNAEQVNTVLRALIETMPPTKSAI